MSAEDSEIVLILMEKLIWRRNGCFLRRCQIFSLTRPPVVCNKMTFAIELNFLSPFCTLEPSAARHAPALRKAVSGSVGDSLIRDTEASTSNMS